MNLQDTLFNWLQMKIVAEARPDDRAAVDTLEFFDQILREDHKLSDFLLERKDGPMIHVRYESDGKSKLQMFDRETAERLLTEIEENPKYNQ
jgi:hypothetical protein